jgi:hypothetical protein
MINVTIVLHVDQMEPADFLKKAHHKRKLDT